MDMRAYLLTSLSRPKNSDHRNFWLLKYLRWLDIVSKEGIEFRRDGLVVVYAVEPDAEKVHGKGQLQCGGRRVLSSILTSFIMVRKDMKCNVLLISWTRFNREITGSQIGDKIRKACLAIAYNPF
jgi:hypothetical protein